MGEYLYHMKCTVIATFKRDWLMTLKSIHNKGFMWPSLNCERLLVNVQPKE